MRRALLFVYEPGHFTELVRVARVLRESGGWAVEILFVNEYAVAPRDAAVALSEGFFVLGRGGVERTAAGATAPGSRPFPAVRQLVQRARKSALIEGALASFPLRLAAEVDAARNARDAVKRLLEERQPDLVIFAEENAGHDEFPAPFAIAFARSRGIASLVIPYTVANETELAQYLDAIPGHHVEGILRRVAARAYPQWAWSHRGRTLLRLSPEKILAREWLGTGAARPWSFYSGLGDAMAVESPRMREYWVAQGVPAAKLVEIGALYDDTLAAGMGSRKSRRAELARDLGLDPGRALVVTALPPELAARVRPDFDDYRSLLEFWVASMSRSLPEANIVLRTHPGAPPETTRGLERERVRVSARDTATLVPLADLYVASISATIRWAIACGIPVVNYDVYRLRYADYATAGGVQTLEEKDDFLNTLARLSPGTAGHAAFAERQRAVAPEWGNLDGHAGERLVALATRLVSGRKEHA